MVSCDAPQGAQQATIIVRITTQPFIGVLGGFTETGTDSAFTQCGVNVGGEC
jgi:hypothetical protein